MQESADSACVIRKKFGEGDRPELTDADQYDIEYLTLEEKWRPIVFAAALVIDWLYFQTL